MTLDSLTVLQKFHDAEATYVRGDAGIDGMVAYLAADVGSL
ncbi:hypothetical protein AB0L82_30575 [Nocardia sp. NPDC052001]